jgi:hypothetical protein
MKHEASEIPIQDVEGPEAHEIRSEEVIEVSVEMLGQVGGGGIAISE